MSAKVWRKKEEEEIASVILDTGSSGTLSKTPRNRTKLRILKDAKLILFILLSIVLKKNVFFETAWKKTKKAVFFEKKNVFFFKLEKFV